MLQYVILHPWSSYGAKTRLQENRIQEKAQGGRRQGLAELLEAVSMDLVFRCNDVCGCEGSGRMKIWIWIRRIGGRQAGFHYSTRIRRAGFRDFAA